MTELTQNEPDSIPAKACIICGSPDILSGYPNDLCAGCRTAYINFPIPKWVWLFAGGIGILLLISLVNLPKNISLGIDLEKGIKSANEHKYITAEKELKSFTAAVPQSEEGNAYLIIASFNNLDFETLKTAYLRVENKKIDDEELYNRVTSVIDNLDGYFPSDSLDSFYAKYPPEDTVAMYTGLKNYAVSHPDEVYAQAAYGSYLMDKDQYPAADSLYTGLLKKQDDYLPALYAMATIKRMEDKPADAIVFCDKMLAMNKESTYAMSMKARSLLRQNKNEDALQTALAAASIEPGDRYNRATLALVYHFSKMEKEKNKVVQAMNEDKDSSAMSYYQYALDVINNKQEFH